jgi:hypothetical protein
VLRAAAASLANASVARSVASAKSPAELERLADKHEGDAPDFARLARSVLRPAASAEVRPQTGRQTDRQTDRAASAEVRPGEG